MIDEELRAAIDDPRPGDRFYSRSLASGCYVRAIKRLVHVVHGPCVQVEIEGRQRRGIARNRPRVWKLETWARLAAPARLSRK